MTKFAPLFTWRSAIVESNLPSTTRHVALTLSLHMNERGGSAFPKQATLAKETGLNVQTIGDHLRRLRDEGWLQAMSQPTPGKAVEYMATIPIPKVVSKPPPSEIQGGVENTTKGGVQDTPQFFREVSIETPLANGASAPPAKPRPANPIWDALTEIFGEATTETKKTLRGRICRSLKGAGATPDEIMKRAKAWPSHFEDATFTETALEKHWDTLGRPPLRRR